MKGSVLWLVECGRNGILDTVKLSNTAMMTPALSVVPRLFFFVETPHPDQKGDGLTGVIFLLGFLVQQKGS